MAYVSSEFLKQLQRAQQELQRKNEQESENDSKMEMSSESNDIENRSL